MFSKKTENDRLVIKFNVIDTKIPSIGYLSVKDSKILTNKVLRRRLIMLTKRYSILVGGSKRLKHRNYRD